MPKDSKGRYITEDRYGSQRRRSAQQLPDVSQKLKDSLDNPLFSAIRKAAGAFSGGSSSSKKSKTKKASRRTKPMYYR